MLDLEGLWGRIQKALGNEKATVIADKLGITKQSVYRWRDGEMPGLDNLAKISESSGTSLHWLLTGRGPIRVGLAASYEGEQEQFIPVYFEAGVEKIINDLAEQNARDLSEQVRELATEALISRGLVTDKVSDVLHFIYLGERDHRLVPVKLLGEIAAGEPLHIFEQHETVLVSEDFIKPGRETYTLRVRGDSMIDEGIFDGDLIICIDPSEVVNGATVVALIDGENATVKKYFRKGNQVRLEPANKDYKPIVLPVESVRIQGVVIGIMRRK
jgi:repressor LexA